MTRCTCTQVNGEGSQIILLDSDGTVAAAAARELAATVPQAKGVLRVDGGTENWKAADLPWKESPQLPALPSFKLPSLTLPSTSSAHLSSCACCWVSCVPL